MLILNIGLARKNKPNTTPARVNAELDSAGFIVNSSTVQNSNTEPTVVAVVIAPTLMVDERINAIAAEFGQDCIAVFDIRSGRGRLVGPDAASWGEFNPAFFLLPDGSLLINDSLCPKE